MHYREIMSRLNAALNSIDLVYATIAKKHNLTFNALMILYLIDESKDITQKQICDELYLPKSTVHSILLDFIKRDFVTLREGKNKKEKIIVLTQDGKQYFSTILEDTQQIEKNVLDTLGEDSCAFLIETAENVGSLMLKAVTKISDDEVTL